MVDASASAFQLLQFDVSQGYWTVGIGVFLCEWRMLGSRDWVFGVSRGCWALRTRVSGKSGGCWASGTGTFHLSTRYFVRPTDSAGSLASSTAISVTFLL